MRVYLVDGTYELFRQYFGAPPHYSTADGEVGAVRGVVDHLFGLLERQTHVGVATDQIIESFRNNLWPGYKTGAGIEADLLTQFPLLEEAVEALGVKLWAMTDFEADDALAAAAQLANRSPEVEQVVIGTPDKDLAQCVEGTRVVCWDNRNRRIIDEQGVWEKFGVGPGSIPDYLALVGDSADGFPGLPGWGAKSSSTVLAKWGSLEAIPPAAADWGVEVRGAAKLAATLEANRELVSLFKTLATLRTDVPDLGSLEDMCWRGPSAAWPAMAERLDRPEWGARAQSLAR